MVARKSETDWRKNENHTNDLDNNNQEEPLFQQIDNLEEKYQTAEIAFKSMQDEYLKVVTKMEEMNRNNKVLKQEIAMMVNENKTLQTQLQKTIQLSQNKIDNMTKVDLSAKKLKQEVLSAVKRDLKSEIESYQQALNKSYIKTNIFMNYLPVIISIIFVLLIVYYLMTGLH